MTIWLVTWNIDNTQFIVDAETAEEAISKSILAHKAYQADYYGTEGGENEETMRDIQDQDSYEAEKVDWEMFCALIERNDKVGVYEKAYVLFG